VSSLDQLSEEQLLALKKSYRREQEKRRASDPVRYFPWHDLQRFFLEAPSDIDGDVRVMLCSGGNRGGKSKAGMGLLAKVLRRESGINDQLVTTDRYTGDIRTKNDRDPVTVWVVPPTLEKARQDWISPQDGMGIKHWCGDLFVLYRKTPDLMVYSRPPGVEPAELEDADGGLDISAVEEKCDKILVKSHDQQLLTFESSEVDMVIFDEEVMDEKIWNSCLLRIATTHGVMVMTYTPIHGLSWSYDRYWKPYIEQGVAEEVADRRWVYDGGGKHATVVAVQMGSRDNPKARTYADEIESDPGMSKAEKEARLYGKYGYVEGTLIKPLAGLDVLNPSPRHEVYVVDSLPGMRPRDGGMRTPGMIVQWLLVADPNKSYGGLLCCVDQDKNLYFVSEHLKEAWPDRKHAEAFRKMEKRYANGPVARYADPGSAGAQSIVNMADSGLVFQNVPKGAGSVSRSVKALRGLAHVDKDHAHPVTGARGAPRVYFYRPGMRSTVEDGTGRSYIGCLLAQQITQARQTDNENAPPDTPHKDVRSKLDLFDCARYAAVIVEEEVHVGNEHKPGKKKSGRNSLTRDMGLKKLREQEIDRNTGGDFFVPEYDFEHLGGVL